MPSIATHLLEPVAPAPVEVASSRLKRGDALLFRPAARAADGGTPNEKNASGDHAAPDESLRAQVDEGLSARVTRLEEAVAWLQRDAE